MLLVRFALWCAMGHGLGPYSGANGPKLDPTFLLLGFQFVGTFRGRCLCRCAAASKPYRLNVPCGTYKVYRAWLVGGLENCAC